MKKILYSLILVSLFSFTGMNPKKKIIYRSPDLDKLLVYVPKQTFSYREADTLIIDNEFVFTNTYSMKSFYIFPYEVSNGQYLEFIHDLKISNDTTLQKALLDTLVWRHKLAYNEPYVEYYFRHPAYRDYPVVGVTHAQCEKYCEWLTKKYNAMEKRKFKKVKFRLPTKYEWYCAASFQNPKKSKKEGTKMSYYADNIFPWNHSSLKNKEGKYLANFMKIDDADVIRVQTKDSSSNFYAGYIRGNAEYMGIASNLNDAADVTAPVNSYWPNDLGIYNLAGNVEEFVAEYGITKGGSWNDPGYYLRNTVIETYNSSNEATSSRGFRFVMQVVEE